MSFDRLATYLCGHLIGHLPQVRHPHESNAAIFDDVLDHLPNGLAPNIQTIAPALRRAADNLTHTPGVALILAGITTETSSVNQCKPNARTARPAAREIDTSR